MGRRLGVAVLVAAAVCGCSGISPTQVGQTAGGLAGGVIVPGVGAPIGTLIGTLAGLVIESQIDKIREQKERVSLQEQLKQRRAAGGGPSPASAAGEPTRIWVDERLESGRLLAGHFEVRAIP